MNDPIIRLLRHKPPPRGVLCVDARATIRAAAQKMDNDEVGALVVMDEGYPLGLLSDRDIVTRVATTGRSADTVCVWEAMTTNPIAVSPNTTVEDAIRLVTASGKRHLVVVEEDKHIAGVVSARDLMSWLVRDQSCQITDLLGYISGRA